MMMSDTLTTAEDLLNLPINTVLSGGFKRLTNSEPAGLDWYLPGSAVGYTAYEIRVPTRVLEYA